MTSRSQGERILSDISESFPTQHGTLLAHDSVFFSTGHFNPSIDHHAGALFGLQQREGAVLVEVVDAIGVELALREEDGEVHAFRQFGQWASRVGTCAGLTEINQMDHCLADHP